MDFQLLEFCSNIYYIWPFDLQRKPIGNIQSDASLSLSTAEWHEIYSVLECIVQKHVHKWDREIEKEKEGRKNDSTVRSPYMYLKWTSTRPHKEREREIYRIGFFYKKKHTQLQLNSIHYRMHSGNTNNNCCTTTKNDAITRTKRTDYNKSLQIQIFTERTDVYPSKYH